MRKYTGWVILATFIFYLLSVALPLLLIVPTFLAWSVPLLTWNTLGKNSRSQTLILFITGIVAIVYAGTEGVFLGWKQVFSINLPLLAMFVAVSFLSLTNPDSEDPDPPRGEKAAMLTAIGTHLLGAVINLSVLFIFGDRLKRNGALTRDQMIILARSFTAAAWWSPFFIATGVALTYSPGMRLDETLIPGLIMGCIAIGYTVVEVCFAKRAEFAGYPLKRENLIVPLFLAAVVIVVHFFWPHISVLLLTCLLAPVGAFVFMKGRPRLSTVYEFIDNRISSVSSQFALFLAAGVFSTGIKSIIHVYPALLSLNGLSFTPFLFAVITGVMIIAGIVGIHPVVSIAIVSPLLLPLNPDPSQLGFMFLTSWAVSTCSSPLSGVGLVMVSRFHSEPRLVIQSNYHYAIAMWAIASLMNILFFAM